jgi:hypothetical protein
MMMQPPARKPEAKSLDARRRTLLLIWAAMLLSLGLYAALALLVRTAGGEAGAANDAVGLALLAAGGAAVLASFVVRQRLLSRAAGEQRPELVTTAYILGFALSEAAGVAGLVSAFVGGGFFYLLFVASAVGLLLHFPRRDDLLAAAYEEGRTTITGN